MCIFPAVHTRKGGLFPDPCPQAPPLRSGPPGRTGRLPARNPHRPGRAQFSDFQSTASGSSGKSFAKHRSVFYETVTRRPPGRGIAPDWGVSGIPAEGGDGAKGAPNNAREPVSVFYETVTRRPPGRGIVPDWGVSGIPAEGGDGAKGGARRLRRHGQRVWKGPPPYDFMSLPQGEGLSGEQFIG